MGTEAATVMRERLTERELQVLDHLEQAQGLDVPLTEYASAYGLDVKDLYAGKAQLVKKGLLPSRSPAPERTDFVPVRVNGVRGGSPAKANGIEPHAYLSRLFAELPKATSADHFESLLPWNIALPSRSAR